MPVNIGEQELKTIGQYVQTHLAEFARNAGITFSDREVLDRILVVEHELKSQRELMQQGFEQMDKRFESMQEQTEKRFESMQEQVDKRVEQVDKRLEQVDRRFESIQHQMDKRFEQVDKRFEDMQHQMDKRFDAADKRFSATQWFIGVGFTLIVVLMSIYQFVAGP